MWTIPADTTERREGEVVVDGDVEVLGTLVLHNATLTARTIRVLGALLISGQTTIQFAGALDPSTDPEQMALGLIVDGRIEIEGTPKTPYVRLATELQAGATSCLLVSAPDGWQVGDVLLIPDSRPLADASQIERRRIVAVDGASIQLDAPLTYSHPGWHDATGQLDPAFLPHVANLTRSVLLMTAEGSQPGHVICQEDAQVRIRYAAFERLGRTTTAPLDSTTYNLDGTVKRYGLNQIGRYALHLHHLHHSGFLVEGCVVDRSRKWGIAIHDSHWGTITDNVVVQAQGAGITTEDGSETENLIARNLVVGVTGTGTRGDERPKEFGFEGAGFWFRGPSNRVEGNIAANCYHPNGTGGYGFKIFQAYLGQIRVPTVPDQPLTQRVQVDSHSLPVRSFIDNEVYACNRGLTLWWVGCANTSRRGTTISTIDRYVAWNTRVAVLHYPAHLIVYESPVWRGPGFVGLSSGWYGGDYFSGELVIRHADIRGFITGISFSTVTIGEQRVVDSLIQCGQNIQVSSLWSSGSQAPQGQSVKVLERVRHERWPGTFANGRPADIATKYITQGPVALTQLNRTLVYAHNGVDGDDFEVFFAEQAPDFPVPMTRLNANGTVQLAGAPTLGYTNALLWDAYQLAIHGQVAAGSTTRSEIQGFAVPLSGEGPA